VISNGVWTHVTNPAGNIATYRLGVTVGGAFTLGSNAQVNVDSLGSGWKRTRRRRRDPQGPSHGGQGGFQQSSTPAATYGSAFHPPR